MWKKRKIWIDETSKATLKNMFVSRIRSSNGLVGRGISFSPKYPKIWTSYQTTGTNKNPFPDQQRELWYWNKKNFENLIFKHRNNQILMNTESEWKNNGTSCQFFSGLLALHVKSSSLSVLEIDKEKKNTSVRVLIQHPIRHHIYSSAASMLRSYIISYMTQIWFLPRLSNGFWSYKTV